MALEFSSEDIGIISENEIIMEVSVIQWLILIW
nr:MAG TPA: hypothetical protein [Caudoviricetes sp.]DAY74582.1 MAG TPA: hypothetical protein [Caudoviricetes sp.]